MRASLLLILAVFLAPSCAVPGAQVAEYEPSVADRAAIEAVIQAAFDAIETNDQAAWAEVLTEKGMFTSIRGEAGARRIGYQTYAEAAANTTPPPNAYLERWWDPIILVDGDLAMVWTPYDFLIDGEFSHAGIDAIVLVRSDAGWKIASIAWNVEPTPREGAPEIAQLEAPPVLTEVFLVVAVSGQPAELRLREADAHRFPISSREEVAAVIAQRSAKTVRLRHGKTVPQGELYELARFLMEQGVTRIEYVLASPPPSNPKPRA